MTQVTDAACECGCNLVTDVTNAAEPCGCGCACCADRPKDAQQEIAELRRLREQIERRLGELETG